ncbi:hypothetical protein [Pasteuria penetrans]|uniref:hypothetical protein n=1 Tax=Pasteuria penetrans TaxID=86005 RepID=UPI000FB14A83|nr:hypothetical protein [Pasteuria penetrans]
MEEMYGRGDRGETIPWTTARYSPTGFPMDRVVEARDEEKELSMIIYVNTQKALHSDKDFGIDYRSNHAPEDDKTLYFDGGYNCHEVREAAKKRTIDIHPTDMMGRKENPSKKRVSGFKRGKDGTIDRCPWWQDPRLHHHVPTRREGQG